MFDYSLLHWTTFLGAAVLLNLAPGPDIAFILGRTVAGGRRAGFAAMFGIWSGAFVHVLAAAVGLSAILATSALFVDLEIRYPLAMVLFLVLTCLSFSLFGFIIGIWAQNFEQLQLIPLLVITPLVFLGGAFYSISMLPPAWQTVTLFNPVVYLVSGFRWSFFGVADVPVLWSLVAIGLFTALTMPLSMA